MRTNNSNINKTDWKLISIYLLLIVFGWINIYSASKTDLHFKILDFSTEYGRQILWVVLSFFLIIPVLFLDTRFYKNFSGIFYIISILSLIGLFVFGKRINGASSWYAIGSITTIQPTEFAKIAVSLAIANLISDKQFDFEKVKNQFIALIYLLIPALLIILQPDPGSALVYLSFFFVFYREGLPKYYISIAISLLLIAIFTIKFGYISIEISIVFLFILFLRYMYKYKNLFFRKFWIQYIGVFIGLVIFIFGIHYSYKNLLPKRHTDRIDLALNITEDTINKGYNQEQSKIAIGSGGFFGKGFLEGTQTKGNFVPEQKTDFIFSTVGEEWGFIGSSIVIILFVILILRIIYIAELQKSRFSRVYGYSIASIFFIHFTINIGMALGVLPTIGIPLPFFSYGGSSFLAFTLLLFIFIRLDANRTNEW
ncbi:MAG: rod shape-determining protein RodA [Flavobacteriaceae bacterium]